MNKLKDTYKIIYSVVLTILLFLPTIITDLHIVLHDHSDHEQHHHKSTTFCDKTIELCACNDFVFNSFYTSFGKLPYKVTYSFFESIVINSIEKSYTYCFLSYKKGRSPPLYF